MAHAMVSTLFGVGRKKHFVDIQHARAALTDRYLKLQLRAFNGECDATVDRVTYKNLDMSLRRVARAYDAINKLGERQS